MGSYPISIKIISPRKYTFVQVNICNIPYNCYTICIFQHLEVFLGMCSSPTSLISFVVRYYVGIYYVRISLPPPYGLTDSYTQDHNVYIIVCAVCLQHSPLTLLITPSLTFNTTLRLLLHTKINPGFQNCNKL